MAMKTAPKLGLYAIAFFATLYGVKSGMESGYIPRPNALKTLVPLKTETIQAEVLTHSSDVKVVPLPSTAPASGGGSPMRYLIWAWNSQMGLLFANGGAQTTKGSLMEAHGVNIQFTRQDSPDQMQNELVAFATELENGNPEPRSGAHFVAIMGDGAAAFLQGVNPRLKKLGDEYIAEWIGSAGYSRGEDSCMGLPEWKTNPQSMKGALIAAYLRDGDWNLCLRFMQINQIPNNPDDTVYDPNAVNWVAAGDYIDASNKYISNYCVTLPVKGKPGQTKKVCVNGVATWTPGDVMVAEQRGGLVTLMSTKAAVFQMPNAVIGIKKWNAAHADKIAHMIAAMGEGADQIRVNPAAFQRAGEISAKVYGEKDANYWMTYSRGKTVRDAQGHEVELGGSYQSNLADVRQLFGLTGQNIAKATYESWGNVVIQQYPNVMKEYPPADEVINSRYVKLAAAKTSSVTQAEQLSYSANTPISEIVGKRDYRITFRTGSAEILAASAPIITAIYNDLVTSNTTVIIHGHTDSTGNPDGNLALSRARAASVKQTLVARGGSVIPDSRIRIVAHGQDSPVADNATEAGRAANRRVEIVLGR